MANLKDTILSNYKETTISGESYQRCRLIEIDNQYNQVPNIIFSEERINILGEHVITDVPNAPIVVQFNPDEVINIYNPETLLPVGSTITMGEMYVFLFSAYLHYAHARDNV